MYSVAYLTFLKKTQENLQITVVASLDTVDLVYNEMEHPQSSIPNLFLVFYFRIIEMIGLEPKIGENLFSCFWHKLYI